MSESNALSNALWSIGLSGLPSVTDETATMGLNEPIRAISEFEAFGMGLPNKSKYGLCIKHLTNDGVILSNAK